MSPARPGPPADPLIAAAAAAHRADACALPDVLRALQARDGGLAPTTIAAVARALRVPVEQAYGVATFYSMLDVTPTPVGRPTVRMCDGLACWLAGATEARLRSVAAARPDWRVTRSSCLGLCDRAPAALVDDRPAGPLDDAASLADPRQWPAAAPDYSQPLPGEVRVLLAAAGRSDPASIEAARMAGAYVALRQALAGPPEAVIAEIEAAGLAGRGGAGFPAARKWRMVAGAGGATRYVVVNADESEPMAFKDRALIDADPHELLEGLALAAYAVGAREGIVYIRGEYAAQAAMLERAIQAAEGAGWLGERVGGTGFSLRVLVHRGAGAYICGEETALLESLEGRRGEPRLRPPYPTTHGYRGCPTLVNNVETLAAVPAIVRRGAAWYRGLSAAPTPGTKLYTLVGHVNRPGLFEAPFGLTLRQVIDGFGGGMRGGAPLGLALTGGAAGTIVPPALLDVPIDHAPDAYRVSLGAGAFLICDETVSPVALLREILRFFALESCGKCTPCRIGTRDAHAICARMSEGDGRAGDVVALTELAQLLRTASFCGLGQSAALPMLSALTHFAPVFARAEAARP